MAASAGEPENLLGAMEVVGGSFGFSGTPLGTVGIGHMLSERDVS